MITVFLLSFVASARPADIGRRPTPDRDLERAAGETHADAILADDRRRDNYAPLVSVGELPGLPHYSDNRPAHT